MTSKLKCYGGLTQITLHNVEYYFYRAYTHLRIYGFMSLLCNYVGSHCYRMGTAEV